MNILQKWENKYLIIPKILQLVVCLQYYTLHNLRHLFATDKFEVSTTQYAEFISYIQGATFFTNIYWGMMADRTGKHRKTLIFLNLTTCGIFMLFFADNVFQMNVWAFWSILLVYQFFNMPKQPLLDKIILDYLAQTPNATPESYGRQRAWGTIAYTLATFIAESMVKKHVGDKCVYSWGNLLIYCIIFTAISVTFLSLLVKTPENVRATNQQSGGYKELLRNPEFSFFIFIMFLNAITRQAMSNYLGNFFARILKIKPYSLPSSWPPSLKSVVQVFNQNYISTFATFGTFFEILSMYFSESIINFLGYFKPLLIAQLISLIRFYAYFVMDKKGKNVFGWCCLIELLKGLYFGLAHISGFAIASRLAPSYLTVTSQMIFQGVFNVMGSLVSGKLFAYFFEESLKKKKDDPVTVEEVQAFESLFAINMLIALFTISIFIVKYGVMDKILTNNKKEKEKLTYK
ncbi:MFS transporter protein [Nucleospora cyclopteri]